jgi:hypothetical protein
MSIHPVENYPIDFQLSGFHPVKQAQKERGRFRPRSRIRKLAAA